MLASDVLYAAPIESLSPSVSAKEALLQDPQRFEAPLDYSMLKDVSRGEKKSFIIHIQDAHSNLSGQQNLAGALDELMKRYDISLVLVEGGTRDDSLTPLKKLASPDVWKQVAKKFLMEGAISGEEYLNLTSERPMKIMGIEDKELYWDSLRAYDRLADKRGAILLQSKKLRNALEKLKNKFYPSDLKEYETLKDGQGEAGDSAFEERFEKLITLAEKNEKTAAILKSFPNVQTLLEIQRKEKDIDFNAANLEQAALLEELAKRGAGGDIRTALSRLSALKNSRLSQLNFIESLLRGAHERSVSLEAYPNLPLYEKYLQSFLGIDFEKLLDESERLEDEVYRACLPAEDARLVRSIDRYIGLLDMAYRIQMSTKEFELFKLNEPDFSTAAYLGFVNRKLADLGYFDDLLPMQDIFDETKSALVDFYASVSRRDEAFMRNAEKILGQEKQQVAVLIAGGYHTSNLKKLFAEKGYSYAVLAPIVTAETNQEKYEKILLEPIRKKTISIETSSGDPGSGDKPLSALEEDLQGLKKKSDGIRAEAAAENVVRLSEVLAALPQNPDSATAAMRMLRPQTSNGARLAESAVNDLPAGPHRDKYEKEIFPVLQSAMERAPAGSMRTLIIAGVSGAGKTTMTNMFQDHLMRSGHKVVIMSADDYRRFGLKRRPVRFLITQLILTALPFVPPSVMWRFMMDSAKDIPRMQVVSERIASFVSSGEEKIEVDGGFARKDPLELTRDTYLLIEGDYAEEMFGGIPGAVKVFLDTDRALARKSIEARGINQFNQGRIAAFIKSFWHSSWSADRYLRSVAEMGRFDFTITVSDRENPELIRHTHSSSGARLAKSSSKGILLALAMGLMSSLGMMDSHQTGETSTVVAGETASTSRQQVVRAVLHDSQALFSVTDQDMDRDSASNLFKTYSAYKLRSEQAVDHFARLLAARIKEVYGDDIAGDPEGWMLATSQSKDTRTPVYAVAERVAALLNVKHVVFVTDPPKSSVGPSIYSTLPSAEERARALADERKVPEGVAPGWVAGKKAIVIDDLINTGTIMEHVVDEILFRNGAKEAHVFAFIRLITEKPEREAWINAYLFSHDHAAEIARIITESMRSAEAEKHKAALNIFFNGEKIFRGVLGFLDLSALLALEETARPQIDIQKYAPYFEALEKEIRVRKGAGPSGARLAAKSGKPVTFARRAVLWGLGGSLLAGGAVLNERWVESAEQTSDRTFSAADYDFEIVPVTDENLQRIRNGAARFVSTTNLFRNLGSKEEAIGLLKIDGEEIHEFNPNSRQSATQRVLAVIDGDQLVLHEDADAKEAARIAQNSRTVFQAGPLAVRNGDVNEHLWSWYRGFLNGRARVLGVDAAGNWHSKEFYGLDRFGFFGKTSEDFEADFRAWQRSNHIEQALFVDGGSAGIGVLDLQRPPYVLVAVPKATGARLAATAKTSEELNEEFVQEYSWRRLEEMARKAYGRNSGKIAALKRNYEEARAYYLAKGASVNGFDGPALFSQAMRIAVMLLKLQQEPALIRKALYFPAYHASPSTSPKRRDIARHRVPEAMPIYEMTEQNLSLPVSGVFEDDKRSLPNEMNAMLADIAGAGDFKGDASPFYFIAAVKLAEYMAYAEEERLVRGVQVALSDARQLELMSVYATLAAQVGFDDISRVITGQILRTLNPEKYYETISEKIRLTKSPDFIRRLDKLDARKAEGERIDFLNLEITELAIIVDEYIEKMLREHVSTLSKALYKSPSLRLRGVKPAPIIVGRVKSNSSTGWKVIYRRNQYSSVDDLPDRVGIMVVVPSDKISETLEIVADAWRGRMSAVNFEEKSGRFHLDFQGKFFGPKNPAEMKMEVIVMTPAQYQDYINGKEDPVNPKMSVKAHFHYELERIVEVLRGKASQYRFRPLGLLGPHENKDFRRLNLTNAVEPNSDRRYTRVFVRDRDTGGAVRRKVIETDRFATLADLLVILDVQRDRLLSSSTDKSIFGRFGPETRLSDLPADQHLYILRRDEGAPLSEWAKGANRKDQQKFLDSLRMTATYVKFAEWTGERHKVSPQATEALWNLPLSVEMMEESGGVYVPVKKAGTVRTFYNELLPFAYDKGFPHTQMLFNAIDRGLITQQDFLKEFSEYLTSGMTKLPTMGMEWSAGARLASSYPQELEEMTNELFKILSGSSVALPGSMMPDLNPALQKTFEDELVIVTAIAENPAMSFTPEEKRAIRRAYVLAFAAHQFFSVEPKNRFRKMGGLEVPYITHPVGVAKILVEEFGPMARGTDAQLDAMTVITALMHDVFEDTNLARLSPLQVAQLLGMNYDQEYLGIWTMIDDLSKKAGQNKAEQYKSLIDSIERDPGRDRTRYYQKLLIKLADKLHSTRQDYELAKDHPEAITLNTARKNLDFLETRRHFTKHFVNFLYRMGHPVLLKASMYWYSEFHNIETLERELFKQRSAEIKGLDKLLALYPKSLHPARVSRLSGNRWKSSGFRGNAVSIVMDLAAISDPAEQRRYFEENWEDFFRIVRSAYPPDWLEDWMISPEHLKKLVLDGSQRLHPVISFTRNEQGKYEVSGAYLFEEGVPEEDVAVEASEGGILQAIAVNEKWRGTGLTHALLEDFRERFGHWASYIGMATLPLEPGAPQIDDSRGRFRVALADLEMTLNAGKTIRTDLPVAPPKGARLAKSAELEEAIGGLNSAEALSFVQRALGKQPRSVGPSRLNKEVTDGLLTAFGAESLKALKEEIYRSSRHSQMEKAVAARAGYLMSKAKEDLFASLQALKKQSMLEVLTELKMALYHNSIVHADERMGVLQGRMSAKALSLARPIFKDGLKRIDQELSESLSERDRAVLDLWVDAREYVLLANLLVERQTRAAIEEFEAEMLRVANPLPPQDPSASIQERAVDAVFSVAAWAARHPWLVFFVSLVGGMTIYSLVTGHPAPPAEIHPSEYRAHGARLASAPSLGDLAYAKKKGYVSAALLDALELADVEVLPTPEGNGTDDLSYIRIKAPVKQGGPERGIGKGLSILSQAIDPAVDEFYLLFDAQKELVAIVPGYPNGWLNDMNILFTAPFNVPLDLVKNFSGPAAMAEWARQDERAQKTLDEIEKFMRQHGFNPKLKASPPYAFARIGQNDGINNVEAYPAYLGKLAALDLSSGGYVLLPVFPSVYNPGVSMSADEGFYKSTFAEFLTADFSSNKDALDIATGSGFTVWVQWMAARKRGIEKEIHFHAVELNPIAAANARFFLNDIMGIGAQVEEGGSPEVFGEKDFSFASANGPAYPPDGTVDTKPGRLSSLHDGGEAGVVFARNVSRWAKKNLKPGQKFILWPGEWSERERHVAKTYAALGLDVKNLNDDRRKSDVYLITVPGPKISLEGTLSLEALPGERLSAALSRQLDVKGASSKIPMASIALSTPELLRVKWLQGQGVTKNHISVNGSFTAVIQKTGPGAVSVSMEDEDREDFTVLSAVFQATLRWLGKRGFDKVTVDPRLEKRLSQGARLAKSGTGIPDLGYAREYIAAPVLDTLELDKVQFIEELGKKLPMGLKAYRIRVPARKEGEQGLARGAQILTQELGGEEFYLLFNSSKQLIAVLPADASGEGDKGKIFYLAPYNIPVDLIRDFQAPAAQLALTFRAGRLQKSSKEVAAFKKAMGFEPAGFISRPSYVLAKFNEKTGKISSEVVGLDELADLANPFRSVRSAAANIQFIGPSEKAVLIPVLPTVYPPTAMTADDHFYETVYREVGKIDFSVNKNVLDAATGSGMVLALMWLAAKSKGIEDTLQYHAFDINPMAVANARLLTRDILGMDADIRLADSPKVFEAEGKRFTFISANSPSMEYVNRTATPSQKAWDGEPAGRVFAQGFASSLPNILAEKGEAILWHLSNNEDLSAESVYEKTGLHIEHIRGSKVYGLVYKITRGAKSIPSGARLAQGAGLTPEELDKLRTVAIRLFLDDLGQPVEEALKNKLSAKDIVGYLIEELAARYEVHRLEYLERGGKKSVDDMDKVRASLSDALGEGVADEQDWGLYATVNRLIAMDKAYSLAMHSLQVFWTEADKRAVNRVLRAFSKAVDHAKKQNSNEAKKIKTLQRVLGDALEMLHWYVFWSEKDLAIGYFMLIRLINPEDMGWAVPLVKERLEAIEDPAVIVDVVNRLFKDKLDAWKQEHGRDLIQELDHDLDQRPDQDLDQDFDPALEVPYDLAFALKMRREIIWELKRTIGDVPAHAEDLEPVLKKAEELLPEMPDSVQHEMHREFTSMRIATFAAKWAVESYEQAYAATEAGRRQGVPSTIAPQVGIFFGVDRDRDHLEGALHALQGTYRVLTAFLMQLEFFEKAENQDAFNKLLAHYLNFHGVESPEGITKVMGNTAEVIARVEETVKDSSSDRAAAYLTTLILSEDAEKEKVASVLGPKILALGENARKALEWVESRHDAHDARIVRKWLEAMQPELPTTLNKDKGQAGYLWNLVEKSPDFAGKFGINLTPDGQSVEWGGIRNLNSKLSGLGGWSFDYAGGGMIDEVVFLTHLADKQLPLPMLHDLRAHLFSYLVFLHLGGFMDAIEKHSKALLQLHKDSSESEKTRRQIGRVVLAFDRVGTSPVEALLSREATTTDAEVAAYLKEFFSSFPEELKVFDDPALSDGKLLEMAQKMRELLYGKSGSQAGARLAGADPENISFAMDSWTPSALRMIFKKIIPEKLADHLAPHEEVTVKVMYEKGMDEWTLRQLRQKKSGIVPEYFRYKDGDGRTQYLFPVPPESAALDPQAQSMLAYLREVGHPHKELTGIWKERPGQSAFRMIAAIYYHTRQMLYIRSLVMTAPEQVYSIQVYSKKKQIFSAQVRVFKNTDDTRAIEILGPDGAWERVYETPKDRPIDKKAREEEHILGTERLVLGKFAGHLREIDLILDRMKEFAKLSPKADNRRAVKARQELERISKQLESDPDKLDEMKDGLSRAILSQRKQIGSDLAAASEEMSKGGYRVAATYLRKAEASLRSEIERLKKVVERHEGLKSAVMSERASLSSDAPSQGARLAADWLPEEVEQLIVLRHGNIYDGRKDRQSSLTPEGRRNAREASRSIFKEFESDIRDWDRDVLIVSSPLRRARQTAEQLRTLVFQRTGRLLDFESDFLSVPRRNGEAERLMEFGRKLRERSQSNGGRKMFVVLVEHSEFLEKAFGIKDIDYVTPFRFDRDSGTLRPLEGARLADVSAGAETLKWRDEFKAAFLDPAAKRPLRFKENFFRDLFSDLRSADEPTRRALLKELQSLWMAEKMEKKYGEFDLLLARAAVSAITEKELNKDADTANELAPLVPRLLPYAALTHVYHLRSQMPHIEDGQFFDNNLLFKKHFWPLAEQYLAANDPTEKVFLLWAIASALDEPIFPDASEIGYPHNVLMTRANLMLSLLVQKGGSLDGELTAEQRGAMERMQTVLTDIKSMKGRWGERGYARPYTSLTGMQDIQFKPSMMTPENERADREVRFMKDLDHDLEFLDTLLSSSGARLANRVVKTARIILQNEQNEILLLQKNPASSQAGMWELPGGKIDGEKPRKAVRRELWEEAGLTGAKIEPVGRTEENIETIHGIRSVAVFKGRVAGKQKIALDKKGIHSDGRWFSLAEIGRMQAELTPATLLSLQKEFGKNLSGARLAARAPNPDSRRQRLKVLFAEKNPFRANSDGLWTSQDLLFSMPEYARASGEESLRQDLTDMGLLLDFSKRIDDNFDPDKEYAATRASLAELSVNDPVPAAAEMNTVLNKAAEEFAKDNKGRAPYQITVAGVTFFQKRNGTRKIWAFKKSDWEAVKARFDLEIYKGVGPDDVALARNSLAANSIVNPRGIAARLNAAVERAVLDQFPSVNGVQPRPNKIQVSGVDLERKWSGGQPVWTFKKPATQDELHRLIAALLYGPEWSPLPQFDYKIWQDKTSGKVQFDRLSPVSILPRDSRLFSVVGEEGAEEAGQALFESLESDFLMRNNFLILASPGEATARAAREFEARVRQATNLRVDLETDFLKDALKPGTPIERLLQVREDWDRLWKGEPPVVVLFIDGKRYDLIRTLLADPAVLTESNVDFEKSPSTAQAFQFVPGSNKFQKYPSGARLAETYVTVAELENGRTAKSVAAVDGKIIPVAAIQSFELIVFGKSIFAFVARRNFSDAFADFRERVMRGYKDSPTRFAPDRRVLINYDENYREPSAPAAAVTELATPAVFLKGFLDRIEDLRRTIKNEKKLSSAGKDKARRIYDDWINNEARFVKDRGKAVVVEHLLREVSGVQRLYLGGAVRRLGRAHKVLLELQKAAGARLAVVRLSDEKGALASLGELLRETRGQVMQIVLKLRPGASAATLNVMSDEKTDFFRRLTLEGALKASGFSRFALEKNGHSLKVTVLEGPMSPQDVLDEVRNFKATNSGGSIALHDDDSSALAAFYSLTAYPDAEALMTAVQRELSFVGPKLELWLERSDNKLSIRPLTAMGARLADTAQAWVTFDELKQAVNEGAFMTLENGEKIPAQWITSLEFRGWSPWKIEFVTGRDLSDVLRSFEEKVMRGRGSSEMKPEVRSDKNIVITYLKNGPEKAAAGETAQADVTPKVVSLRRPDGDELALLLRTFTSRIDLLLMDKEAPFTIAQYNGVLRLHQELKSATENLLKDKALPGGQRSRLKAIDDILFGISRTQWNQLVVFARLSRIRALLGEMQSASGARLSTDQDIQDTSLEAPFSFAQFYGARLNAVFLSPVEAGAIPMLLPMDGAMQGIGPVNAEALAERKKAARQTKLTAFEAPAATVKSLEVEEIEQQLALEERQVRVFENAADALPGISSDTLKGVIGLDIRRFKGQQLAMLSRAVKEFQAKYPHVRFYFMGSEALIGVSAEVWEGSKAERVAVSELDGLVQDAAYVLFDHPSEDEALPSRPMIAYAGYLLALRAAKVSDATLVPNTVLAEVGRLSGNPSAKLKGEHILAFAKGSQEPVFLSLAQTFMIRTVKLVAARLEDYLTAVQAVGEAA